MSCGKMSVESMDKGMDTMAAHGSTAAKPPIPTSKNWTDQGIKSLKDPKPYRVDRCLYIRVSDTGAKRWVFRWRKDGKLRDMGLGSYGKAADQVTLADARQLAAKYRAFVKEGKDPIIERDREKAANSPDDVPTFSGCREAYIKAHAPAWSNPKHAQQWTNTLKTYAEPVIGKLPVNLVDDDHVYSILDAIWLDKTETAVRLRGRIERVLAWAEAKGYRKGLPNPARRDGPLAIALPKPSKIKKVQHHKSLPYPELNPFMKELRQQNGVAASALEFTILCCARTGETIGAEWSEFDLDTKVWTVPAERMKAKKPHRVPLSEAAIKVVEAQQGQDEKWVFPGLREGKHLSNMAMLSLLKDMGKDFTVHGFRSSFKNWAAERTNFPRQVVEFAMAHVNKDTTEAAYLHSDLLEKRLPLMDKWAKHCNTKPIKATVTKLKSKA